MSEAPKAMQSAPSALEGRDITPVEAFDMLQKTVTNEALDLYQAAVHAPTHAEFVESMRKFNALGAGQLNRADAASAETLAKESLAGRQVSTVIEYTANRKIRIARAKNGVYTLEDGFHANDNF